jgi:putative ABC transport system substrate-binding protein
MLGAAAATWPATAIAQQSDRMKRIGVLMSTAEGDPREKASAAAFAAALGKLGWIERRNLEISYRWGDGDAERMAANAREIVGQVPDVIVVKGANLPALRKVTSTIPVVFVMLNDAIAQEYVTSFARPTGNITGFTSDELALVGKRLELLREASPGIVRLLYLTSRNVGAGTANLLGRIMRDATSAGISLIDGSAESSAEIEAAVQAFAREPNGGLIGAFNAFVTVHRTEIVALAARYRLPAIYPLRAFADGGGLLSYGFDQDDQFRQAALYVARILKGEKPADLPVQEPTKYELVINLKTAKALGLTIPPTLLATADEVIE